MQQRLEVYLAYAESNRLTVCSIGALLVILIAWIDAKLPTMSIGFLYLLPILLAAAALNGFQIILLAGLCSFLREAYDPLQWSAGASGRFLAAGVGFAMTGFFVAGLNQRRRLLQTHLRDLEAAIKQREDAESQVRALIDTSPLAILTINQAGRIVLANESAKILLGLVSEDPEGMEVASYFPILPRMLQSHHRGIVRTNVECKARRRSGELFLAHIWVSTYRTSSGPGLAAVIWDASENLRDREGAVLNSMLATSRVLIGAISHEIRNLASAAATSYAALGASNGLGATSQYDALGSLIRALESIANSGLRMASNREPAVTDLGTVMDEARIVIEPLLEEAGFAVTWNIQDNLPLVQADQHSLLQVFVNLARNIRAHAADCQEPSVYISAASENDLVVVRFRDHGPGVDHPDQLFQPFQPGSQSTGLGLYISRAILRSHGGNLRYEPASQGACFLVELWPVEQPVES